MPLRVPRAGLALLCAYLGGGCSDGTPAAPLPGDAELRAAIDEAEVTPLAPIPPQDPARVRLGHALFFDKVLSGNRDIGCSTCHNPAYHTSDQLPLSIGTGGHRPGSGRQLGTGTFLGRNSIELFDRGRPSWHVLLADGRVSDEGGHLVTPFGARTPDSLDGALAAQALFPLQAREEMRGHAGDLDRLGQPNELALLPDTALAAIWAGIVARVVALPGYDTLLAAAYPGLAPGEVRIHHLTNALAAFVRVTWQTGGSPFDRYLGGDSTALSPEATSGARLFFGRARCSHCHSGPMLSDQEFHNVGVPPVGPGLVGGLDEGRAAVTGDPADRFRFRTPPLRNVDFTAPFMHNGVFSSLDAVIRHYSDIPLGLTLFDPSTVDGRLRPTLRLDPATQAAILATLDSVLRRPIRLSATEVQDLHAFLKALTDPKSSNLLSAIPATVPSGLPVFDY